MPSDEIDAELLRWTIIGRVVLAIIGIVAIFTLFYFLEQPRFIYNYQTLIAGILAFFGAAATVWIVNRQIGKTQEIELERRRRKNFSARALMPDALSGLCDYSSTCVKILLPLQPTSDKESAAKAISTMPKVPKRAIRTLRECIEFADDEVGKNIADLLAKLQILRSRTVDYRYWLSSSGKIIIRPNIVDNILLSLDIHARSSKLFHYARREVDVGPENIGVTDINRSAFICDVYDDYEDIHQTISRRYENIR